METEGHRPRPSGFDPLAAVETRRNRSRPEAVGADKKALVVLPNADKMVVASFANIAGVKTSLYNTINVYDILNADKFVVTKEAVEKLEEVYA